MKALIDELRIEKEWVNKLKDANRNLDKSSKIQQERMIRLEENIRELKQIKK
jgi:hypothetical protein